MRLAAYPPVLDQFGEPCSVGTKSEPTLLPS